eukprot:1331077-Rhodomonas_salina.2
MFDQIRLRIRLQFPPLPALPAPPPLPPGAAEAVRSRLQLSAIIRVMFHRITVPDISEVRQVEDP